MFSRSDTDQLENYASIEKLVPIRAGSGDDYAKKSDKKRVAGNPVTESGKEKQL